MPLASARVMSPSDVQITRGFDRNSKFRGGVGDPVPEAARVTGGDRHLVARLVVDLPEMDSDMSDHAHGGISGLERAVMQIDRKALGERASGVRSSDANDDTAVGLLADRSKA